VVRDEVIVEEVAAATVVGAEVALPRQIEQRAARAALSAISDFATAILRVRMNP
jgi:hypothetical protein